MKITASDFKDSPLGEVVGVSRLMRCQYGCNTSFNLTLFGYLSFDKEVVSI